MSKNYEGKQFYGKYDGAVSIILNTANRLVLEADPAGEWSNKDIPALWNKLKALAKEHNAEINIFKPEPSGTDMHIRSGKGGNVYLALMPETGTKARKKRVKLA